MSRVGSNGHMRLAPIGKNEVAAVENGRQCSAEDQESRSECLSNGCGVVAARITRSKGAQLTTA